MDDYEGDGLDEGFDAGDELYDTDDELLDVAEDGEAFGLAESPDAELLEPSAGTASEAAEDEELVDFSPLEGKVPDITEAQEAKCEADLLELQERIGEVNPNYDPFELDDYPYNNNCGSCAAAVWDRLEGTGDTVASDRTLSVAEMEAHTGLKQVEATPEEIEAHVRSLGPGGHVVVGVDRAVGSGHWFNAYTPNGRDVYYVDGQNATVSPWPPTDMGAVVRWDMSKR